MPSNNQILLAVLALGGLVLLTKSDDKEKVKVEEARDDAIAGGVKEEVAKDLYPSPPDEGERAVLKSELAGALEQWDVIENWIEDNQKEYNTRGVPSRIWLRVLRLRGVLDDIGTRATKYFSVTATTGESFHFWENWRVMWTQVQDVAERQVMKDEGNQTTSFADPINIKEEVPGPSGAKPETFDTFKAIPPPLEPAWETWFGAEGAFHNPNPTDKIKIAVDNRTNAPKGTEVTKREDSAFVVGRPLKTDEVEMQARLNEEFGGAQKAKIKAPQRVPGFGPARKRRGGGRTRATDVPGESTAEAARSGPGPEQPHAFTGRAGAPNFKAITDRPRVKDEPPARPPPDNTAKAPDMPPPKDRSVQTQFNTTKQVIDPRKVPNAAQHVEEEYARGNEDARKLTAEEAQVDLFRAREFEKYANDIREYRDKLLKELKVINPSARVKANVKATWNLLLNYIPEGQENPLIFRGAYYRSAMREANFSPKLIQNIHKLPAFQAWVNAIREVQGPVQKLLGTRKEHPTQDTRPGKRKKPEMFPKGPAGMTLSEI